MDMSSPQLRSNIEDMHAAGGADSASESLLQVQSSLTAAAEQADRIRMGSSASLSGSPDQAAQPKQATTPTSIHVESQHRIAGSQAADAVAADGADAQCVRPEMPGVKDGVTMTAQAALPRQDGAFSSSPLESAPQEEQMSYPDAAAMSESQAELATASAADVTMMTRSAFDSVNSMFQGALPQASAWPQNATSRLAQPRLALAGPVTARLLGSDAAAPAQQTSFLGPEPTVTLSTQAAFSTLNDMFRADLPHQAPRGSAASTAVHPAASGQPLQRSSHSAEGFPVWEDTQLLPSIMEQGSPAAPAVSNSPAIPMYEDTQFLAGSKDVPHSRQPAGDPEMQLYEDTQFHAGECRSRAHSAAQQAVCAGEPGGAAHLRGGAWHAGGWRCSCSSQPGLPAVRGHAVHHSSGRRSSRQSARTAPALGARPVPSNGQPRSASVTSRPRGPHRSPGRECEATIASCAGRPRGLQLPYKEQGQEQQSLYAAPPLEAPEACLAPLKAQST